MVCWLCFPFVVLYSVIIVSLDLMCSENFFTSFCTFCTVDFGVVNVDC